MGSTLHDELQLGGEAAGVRFLATWAEEDRISRSSSFSISRKHRSFPNFMDCSAENITAYEAKQILKHDGGKN